MSKQTEPLQHLPTFSYCPCRYEDPAKTHITVCTPSEAEFWGVYRKTKEGLSTHFEDYALECEAKAVTDALTRLAASQVVTVRMIAVIKDGLVTTVHCSTLPAAVDIDFDVCDLDVLENSPTGEEKKCIRALQDEIDALPSSVY